jgi:flagellar basal-body rod modification protein FlgD
MTLSIGHSHHLATNAAAVTASTSTSTQPSTATTSTAATAATASAASSTPAVSEQQFLQLLVAQLQHQDPTQPLQGTEFVTQLAQFSMVEQSVNQSQQLTNMTSQLTGISNDQTTSLVGQTVTMGGNSITFDGTSASPANVTLAGPAAQVTATITDSNGNIVRQINMGAQAAGVVTIPWDGQNNSGQIAAQGTYSINVTAVGASGAAVAVSPNVTGVVSSVSFSQGYPDLTLSSGAQAPISELVSVGTPATSP